MSLSQKEAALSLDALTASLKRRDWAGKIGLLPVLRMIPTAALAGILVYTGIRLIDFKGMIHLWKQNRIEAAIFLITMIVIVAEDLLTGVVTGIVLIPTSLDKKTPTINTRPDSR